MTDLAKIIVLERFGNTEDCCCGDDCCHPERNFGDGPCNGGYVYIDRGEPCCPEWYCESCLEGVLEQIAEPLMPDDETMIPLLTNMQGLDCSLCITELTSQQDVVDYIFDNLCPEEGHKLRQYLPGDFMRSKPSMTDETLDKVADGIAKDIGPVEPVPKWADRVRGIIAGIRAHHIGSTEDLIAMARLADEAEAARKAKQ